MALIECYECKRNISSEALVCIHCGAPMAEQAAHVQAQAAAAPTKASTISFGSLPRNKAVPEAVVPPAAEPLPKVMPAAAGMTFGKPCEACGNTAASGTALLRGRLPNEIVEA